MSRRRVLLEALGKRSVVNNFGCAPQLYCTFIACTCEARAPKWHLVSEASIVTLVGASDNDDATVMVIDWPLLNDLTVVSSQWNFECARLRHFPVHLKTEGEPVLARL